MASYHLYFVEDYQILGSEKIDAADDEEAQRIAAEHGQGRTVEIWNAHSLIGLVPTSQAA